MDCNVSSETLSPTLQLVITNTQPFRPQLSLRKDIVVWGLPQLAASEIAADEIAAKIAANAKGRKFKSPPRILPGGGASQNIRRLINSRLENTQP